MANGLTYPCFYMYKDTAGYWRWTYYSSNAKAISVSSESYVQKADCQRGVDIMKASYGSTVYEQKAA